jgi:hypothetical protein
MYEQMPTIAPEEAAELVAEAIIRRPQRLATRLGLFAQWVGLLAPKLSELVMSTAFKMFPESPPAAGAAGPAGPAAPAAPAVQAKATPEAILFASLMRGVHW